MARYLRLSTVEEKVQWLVAHPDLVRTYHLLCWPDPDTRIVRAMKRDGLLAKHTYHGDCQVGRWVGLAKQVLALGTPREGE